MAGCLDWWCQWAAEPGERATEGESGQGFSCPRNACYWTTGGGEETPVEQAPASRRAPRRRAKNVEHPHALEWSKGGVRAAPHASRAHTHLQGEGGARRRAARDDSQPSRTRCPVLGWPRRSVSHAPTSRQSKHSPGEVRRWLGSRVVHCLWPGPSAPSSQCVAGFGLPHSVPPWVPLPSQRGPTPSRAGRHLPAEQSLPGGTPSRVQSLHCIQAAGTPSRREAPLQAEHPRGGEHTPWEAHLVPLGTGIPLRVTYSPGECVTAELCPSEGRHDPCIQSFHWVQRILHPSHRRYIPWREHVPLAGGTPSSRGTLHTGEVGPSGGRNPRVRYEGGGWVGRGNRRGLRHPQKARFPFHSSRPRHPTQRHTMPP